MVESVGNVKGAEGFTRRRGDAEARRGRRSRCGGSRRRRSSALQTPSQAERLNHEVAWMGWCVVVAAWEKEF